MSVNDYKNLCRITYRTKGDTQHPGLECELYDADGVPVEIVESLTIRITTDGASMKLDGVDLGVIGSRFDVQLDAVAVLIPELDDLRRAYMRLHNAAAGFLVQQTVTRRRAIISPETAAECRELCGGY